MLLRREYGPKITREVMALKGVDGHCNGERAGVVIGRTWHMLWRADVLCWLQE